MRSQKIQDKIDKMTLNFVQQIRRGNVKRTKDLAKETSKIVRVVVSMFNTHKDKLCTLIKTTRKIGITLEKFYPSHFVIGNCIRRILFIIKDEIYHEIKEKNKLKEGKSLAEKVLISGPSTIVDDSSDVYHKRHIDSLFKSDELSEVFRGNCENVEKVLGLTSSHLKNIKVSVLGELNELILDFEHSTTQIAQNKGSQEHLAKNEVILTIGRSHTVMEFLKVAAKKKKFKVIVTEHSPSLDGHKMAEELSNEINIETVIVSDSAIFSVMARVNKVVIGTRSVLANGGLVAETGSFNVAMAANKHSVPLIVLCALYKLTPKYPSIKNLMNKMNDPGEILTKSARNSKVDVLNFEFDYIPPNFVDILVTNDGVYNPSYIYRLLNEFYDPQDYKLILDKEIEEKEVIENHEDHNENEEDDIEN